GGTFPARVWHDFMSVAMLNQEPLDWPKPPEQLTYTILPPPPDKDKKDGDKHRKKKPGPGRND
ncbi:MAG TPA: hypothetical protein VIJ32_00665, partial [Actinomycetes bacterium]